MAHEPFTPTDETAITPFDPAFDHSAPLSRRAYNFIMGGLVLLGFGVIGACGLIATTPGFLMAVYQNYFLVTIVSLVASIGGIVTISAGMKREGFGMALAGYALVIGSMGFTTGLILPFYDLPSIANAFVGTTLIAAIFTLLGGMYPKFFARVQGIAFAALLSLLVVSIAGSIMGISMGWLDYAVIVVFCGFIGYDTYRAQQCEPTVKMAIFNAVQIWLDLVNVFIRVLSIVGRRD